MEIDRYVVGDLTSIDMETVLACARLRGSIQTHVVGARNVAFFLNKHFRLYLGVASDNRHESDADSLNELASAGTAEGLVRSVAWVPATRRRISGGERVSMWSSPHADRGKSRAQVPWP